MQPDGLYWKKELTHIETAMSLAEDLLGRSEWSAYERIAMGTLLQNAYGGLEGLFRYLLKMRGFDPPKVEQWHKELLQQACEQSLVPLDAQHALIKLLGFRHMHVHGYGHMLQEDRLRVLAGPSLEACRSVIAILRSL
jgi:uncharacterized protein YutE (UPF0331/DUF86 family)